MSLTAVGVSRWYQSECISLWARGTATRKKLWCRIRNSKIRVIGWMCSSGPATAVDWPSLVAFSVTGSGASYLIRCRRGDIRKIEAKRSSIQRIFPLNVRVRRCQVRPRRGNAPFPDELPVVIAAAWKGTVDSEGRRGMLRARPRWGGMLPIDQRGKPGWLHCWPLLRGCSCLPAASGLLLLTESIREKNTRGAG